jgi:hypothetical protein
VERSHGLSSQSGLASPLWSNRGCAGVRSGIAPNLFWFRVFGMYLGVYFSVPFLVTFCWDPMIGGPLPPADRAIAQSVPPPPTSKRLVEIGRHPRIFLFCLTWNNHANATHRPGSPKPAVARLFCQHFAPVKAERTSLVVTLLWRTLLLACRSAFSVRLPRVDAETSWPLSQTHKQYDMNGSVLVVITIQRIVLH